MTKEQIESVIGMKKFEPDDAQDRIDMMTFLQILGKTEDVQLLRTIWEEWMAQLEKKAA